MDKTTQYRRLIKNLLTQHANIVARQCTQEMNTLLSFDEEHDQYLWLQEIRNNWGQSKINCTTNQRS